jgi:hypothetical protein
MSVAGRHGGPSRGPVYRSIIEQGRDPAGEKRDDSEIGPVEELMRYIADELK